MLVWTRFLPLLVLFQVGESRIQGEVETDQEEEERELRRRKFGSSIWKAFQGSPCCYRDDSSFPACKKVFFPFQCNRVGGDFKLGGTCGASCPVAEFCFEFEPSVRFDCDLGLSANDFENGNGNTLVSSATLVMQAIQAAVNTAFNDATSALAKTATAASSVDGTRTFELSQGTLTISINSSDKKGDERKLAEGLMERGGSRSLAEAGRVTVDNFVVVQTPETVLSFTYTLCHDLFQGEDPELLFEAYDFFLSLDTTLLDDLSAAFEVPNVPACH